MSALVFLVIAVLTLASALGVVVGRNPVHCALALVSTLCAIAVLFLGLDAQLIGFLQIIVYAGAIVVLFLFVIMLLNIEVVGRALESGGLVAAAGAGSTLFGALVLVGLGGRVVRAPAGVPSGFGETTAVAERLFTAYLLPFELTSLLLLVAVVGAVAIAKRRP